VVPEILELAAPVLHEDAALIDAEIEIQWAQELLAEPVNLRIVKAWGDEWPEHQAERCHDLETTLAKALDPWRIPRPRLPAAGRSRPRWGSRHERRQS
jgi:hypothetical protein